MASEKAFPGLADLAHKGGLKQTTEIWLTVCLKGFYESVLWKVRCHHSLTNRLQ